MKYQTRLLFAAAALALTTAATRAEQSTFKFADPSQPGRLTVHIARGELQVVGADVDEVTVRTDAERASKKGERRDDGLRVLSSNTSYQMEQADNHMTLTYGLTDWGQAAEFIIEVPRNTALDLRTNYGGEIEVEDVDGNVTIQSLNGEIDLKNLGGGAIIESMNGEISASFHQVTAGNPIAISTMNGEVQVRLPADAAANVRFRSQNGTILTDFDDDVLVTTTTSGPAFAPGMKEEFAQAAREMAQEAAEVARQVAEEVRVAVEEMRANGDLDGDDDTVVLAPKAPRAPRAPRVPSIPAISGGKVISGTLNDAGEANADVQIATMNGDIIVRKLD